MKKSLVLQFPTVTTTEVRGKAAQDPELAKATSHRSREDVIVSVRDEKSFQRFLEAANNLGSHLTSVFDDAFLKVLSGAREASSNTRADARVAAPIQLRSRKARTVETRPDYRIRFAASVGQFTGSRIIDASSDREAIEKARRLLDRDDIELWAGQRLIARLDPVRPWPERPWQAALLNPCRPAPTGHALT
jgi:hypothetical protein